MKVPKAIELLRQVAVQIQIQFGYDVYCALLLAIAALERHRDRDYVSFATFIDKLPGEVVSYAH